MNPAEKLETASWLRAQAEKMKRLGKLRERSQKLEAEADRLEREAMANGISDQQWREMKRKMGFDGTEEEFEEMLKEGTK